MALQDTGTWGSKAADAEILLQKIFATMPIKLADLRHTLPHDDVTLQALASLQEDHPPVDTFARCPNIANMLSMMCEILCGHKIKYIVDPDTNCVTKVRLNHTGRPAIKRSDPPPPSEEEQALDATDDGEDHDEDDDEDPEDSKED